jgi:hypothetical protein
MNNERTPNFRTNFKLGVASAHIALMTVLLNELPWVDQGGMMIATTLTGLTLISLVGHSLWWLGARVAHRPRPGAVQVPLNLQEREPAEEPAVVWRMCEAAKITRS